MVNVVVIGSTAKSRSVIQVPQVAPNIWIINNPLLITLEKNKYNRIQIMFIKMLA